MVNVGLSVTCRYLSHVEWHWAITESDTLSLTMLISLGREPHPPRIVAPQTSAHGSNDENLIPVASPSVARHHLLPMQRTTAHLASPGAFLHRGEKFDKFGFDP